MNRIIQLILVLVLGLTANVSAQVFDIVVAKDDSGDYKTLQEAIDACPDNIQKTIFIKSGIYEEKVMIGSHSKTSSKKLSIIGEDPEKVIITWDDYNGKTIMYDGREVKSGTPQSATFTVNASDFYAENLTIENSYTEKQAVALYNVADRQTFKNCRLIGFQDTHYLKKGRRYYFVDCYIEGGTDYICAGGTTIFDNCTLKSVKNGSFITAPEDITAITTVGDKKYFYGFIFRNCLLTSNAGVEVYLGRPWQGTSSSVFLSCKMENIKPTGWSTWSDNNHLTSFFAENNSLDLNGDLLNVSNRVDWSYQLSNEEVETYYTNEKIYSFVSGEYDPFSLVVSPGQPQNLSFNGETFTWNEVDGAKGYIVYEDDVLIAYVTEATFFYSTAASGKYYAVQAVGQNGNLSLKSEAVSGSTAIEGVELNKEEVYYRNGVLFIPDNEVFELYSLNGILIKRNANEREINLKDISNGLYVIRIKTGNYTYCDKIYLN